MIAGGIVVSHQQDRKEVERDTLGTLSRDTVVPLVIFSPLTSRFQTTPGFSIAHDELVCDMVPVSAIAAAVGTPVYVYSAAAIRERYMRLDQAFGAYPHRLHYALKANSTFALVRLLHEIGSAADANSVWELEVARRAGFSAADIVFTGVGKSAAELECAVSLDLKAINVESSGELARVETLAAQRGRPANIAIRINPDIDARSHPHISTGLRINKFGLPTEDARMLLATLHARPFLRLVAVHVHVGSQITTLDPIRNAARFVNEMARELNAAGHELAYLDLGGGLGIPYKDESAPSLEDYVATLIDELRTTSLPIVIEPGRMLVGPCGVLVATIVDIKPRSADSDFVVIDAGMTELMRPALYGAYHRIEAVRPRQAQNRAYEIVGPVCESSDVVGRDRVLAALEVGDLLAVRDAGAYGSAMASNYNRRPLPAEVLVDNGSWSVIRRRQSVDDLLALEM
jgi:diaminopimelate decarboxylase